VSFSLLSDVLTPEQLVERYVKQAGYGNEKRKVGICLTSLPFGDSLHADKEVPSKLALRHTVFQTQSSDIATKWNFQGKPPVMTLPHTGRVAGFPTVIRLTRWAWVRRAIRQLYNVHGKSY
jgi:hypothetical protein